MGLVEGPIGVPRDPRTKIRQTEKNREIADFRFSVPIPRLVFAKSAILVQIKLVIGQTRGFRGR